MSKYMRFNKQYFLELFEMTKKNYSMTHRREHGILIEGEVYRNFKILFLKLLDSVSMEMKVRFQDCDNLQFLALANITNLISMLNIFLLQHLKIYNIAIQKYITKVII